MKRFNTVAQMKLAKLTAGQTVETSGYYAVGDGGGAAYLVAASQAVDGYGDHALANGNVALLQVSGVLDIKRYGAKGDGVTDDTSAIQAILDHTVGQSGGTVYLPAGTYKVSSPIDLTGCSNLFFYGSGADATVIKTSDPVGNVFVDTGISYWRTFKDFSITSSVTRTAGDYFNLFNERRSLFERLKLTGHFNGFNFTSFEQTELRSCSITTPSGAGSAIICGTSGAAGQGANLLVNDCFLRGWDDVSQTNKIGLYGIKIYDVDAVFCLNTDISAFILNALLIDPATRSANHYFSQCFFDASLQDNVRIQGAGVKIQLQFTGCWFASGGKLSGGSVEACGIRCTNAGFYQDILLSGCRFYNNSGTGALLEMPGAEFNFTGCNFQANGISGVTNRYGLWFTPSTVATIGPVVTGCKFTDNLPLEINLDANSRASVVSGCSVPLGAVDTGSLNIFSGNYDAKTSDVASTLRLTVSPTKQFFNVTGTASIGGIDPTFPGHIIYLKFNGALTVTSNLQNIRLAGNFVTANGYGLTLICDGSEWREISRANIV